MRFLNLRFWTLALAFGSLAHSACGEAVGSGEQVSIPSVTVSCTSAACRATHSSTPRALVMYTRSGCSSIDTATYDENAISGSSSSVSCNASGCTATVSSFVDRSGISAVFMSSDTYSICGWISHDGSMPDESTGQSKAYTDNVLINSSTAAQILSGWFDL